MIAIGLLGLGAALAVRVARDRDRVPATFPLPATTPVVAGPTFDDFVGAETCGECHRAQFEAWRGSTHGRAGGVPTRETVIAGFDGRPMRFADAIVIPRITGDGDYEFTVRQEGRDPITLRVDGVIGGGHMVGGGTQGFVTLFGDGTVRFLPFDFIRDEGVWFCNTDSRLNEGWLPITPRLKLSDCGDWPPIRILGTDAQFANCQECHGSQITVSFDPEAGRYDSRIKSLAINCESCHGPGRSHVERARTDGFEGSAEIDIRTFGTEPPDSSLQVCFQCHAVKDVLRPGYLPGRSFDRHFALKTSVLSDSILFPDGRIQTFAYQENHLYSDCYVSGAMTCVDCHEPHGQGYRDIYGRPLPDRFADGQCLSCHPSKAADIPAHTKHAEASAGSRCVACHMPYLQHPLLGTELRFARSDHTIPIPRPAFDAALGVEPACRQCHTERSVAELQTQTTSWYGALKPHKRLIAAQLAVDTGAPAVERLIDPTLDHPIAQIAGLKRLIENRLRPNMDSLDGNLETSLKTLARSPDPDLRAVALATLHLARGHDRDIRRFLIAELERADATDVAVRDRWVLTLGYYADLFRDRGAFGDAYALYEKALEVIPSHTGVLVSYGIARRQAQDFIGAQQLLERASTYEPNRPDVLVNLGLVLEGQTRDDAAATMYRRALDINPAHSVALLNLGNVHLRRDEFTEAATLYRRAVAADPSLARAHYYLARSYIMQNQLEAALAAARRALEFEPQNEGAREMVRDLERAMR